MTRLFIISILSIISIKTYAQEFQIPKHLTGRKHKGFFLSTGLGFNTTTVNVDSKNYGFATMSGQGAMFDFKIGGAITENLILHATILSHSVTGPKINSKDWNLDNYKTDNKIYIGEGMFGVGITYYTPENYFVSSSLGFGGLTFENEREDLSITTDNGFSYQLKAGKEWWVSPKWGIGVAVYYHNTNVLNQKGNDAEEKIKSNNFGVVFNATVNGRN
jgi:hypothetical protein